MNNKKAVDSGMLQAFIIGLFFCCMAYGQTITAPKLPAGKIDLNKATVEQIGKFPGLNAALAKAIVEFRDKSGPFTKPEDLLNVKGMNREILNKIKPKMEKDKLIVAPPALPADDDEEEPSLKPSKC
jgi:competence ComEA-like helix-hairpin-helix protein